MTEKGTDSEPREEQPNSIVLASQILKYENPDEFWNTLRSLKKSYTARPENPNELEKAGLHNLFLCLAAMARRLIWAREQFPEESFEQVRRSVRQMVRTLLVPLVEDKIGNFARNKEVYERDGSELAKKGMRGTEMQVITLITYALEFGLDSRALAEIRAKAIQAGINLDNETLL